jgi:hypothetical protein
VSATNSGYLWQGRSDVTKKLNSLPGQGNRNPIAVFREHVVTESIVLYRGTKNEKTLLFDPSYGVQYVGKTDAERTRAFQTQALSFIGDSSVGKVPVGVDAGGDTVYIVTVTFQSVNGEETLVEASRRDKKDGK